MTRTTGTTGMPMNCSWGWARCLSISVCIGIPVVIVIELALGIVMYPALGIAIICNVL